MKWVLTALLLLFAPLFLYAASASVSITEYKRPNYRLLLTQQAENYSGNSEMLPMNLNGQESPLINPNNPWQSLRMWISEGLQGLDASSESLTKLEGQLAELRAESSEQESLLRQSQELLENLKQSLAEAQNSVDIAIDRMQDAEEYARWIDAQNEAIKQEIQQSRKSAIIGFTFGGVSFGVGTPLIIEGIRTNNQTMLMSGAGLAVGSGIVWAVGHYLFKWW